MVEICQPTTGGQQQVVGNLSLDGRDLSARYWWTATGSRQTVTGWWRPLSDVSVNGMKSAKHHSMADSMSASCWSETLRILVLPVMLEIFTARWCLHWKAQKCFQCDRRKTTECILRLFFTCSVETGVCKHFDSPMPRSVGMAEVPVLETWEQLSLLTVVSRTQNFPASYVPPKLPPGTHVWITHWITPFCGKIITNWKGQNKHTRELISAWKTSHTYNNKDPSRLQ